MRRNLLVVAEGFGAFAKYVDAKKIEALAKP